jgi:hypothetical protein
VTKARREAKKPAQPIPAIPDLGKLHKPRKGNRKAAKLIESGVRLWDRRHREQKARRQAIRQEENRENWRRRNREEGLFVLDLLAHAPHWQRKAQYKGSLLPNAIEPRSARVEVEELIEAAEKTSLRDSDQAEEFIRLFSVAGLSYRELIRLRAVLPLGVDASFSYHARTATEENARDFRYYSYDPRVSGPFKS